VVLAANIHGVLSDLTIGSAGSGAAPLTGREAVRSAIVRPVRELSARRDNSQVSRGIAMLIREAAIIGAGRTGLPVRAACLAGPSCVAFRRPPVAFRRLERGYEIIRKTAASATVRRAAGTERWSSDPIP